MKLKERILFFLLLNLGFSCSSTHKVKNSQVSVRLHPDVHNDETYFQSLDLESRKVEVYDDFETKFHVQATYLSPEFRLSFDRRFKSLMTASPFSLGESGSHMGFFVSVFTPEDSRVDLTNSNLWSIYLMKDEKKILPSRVKWLQRKERWKAYFPFVNKWSKEFLILFDSPSVSTQDETLATKNEFELFLSNADASIVMSW